jgi:hypothetical protein
MNNCEMKSLLANAIEDMQRVYNALEAAPVNQSTIVDTPVVPMPAESPTSCIGCGCYKRHNDEEYCAFWYPMRDPAHGRCFHYATFYNLDKVDIHTAPCDGVIRECCEEERDGDLH